MNHPYPALTPVKILQQGRFRPTCPCYYREGIITNHAPVSGGGRRYVVWVGEDEYGQCTLHFYEDEVEPKPLSEMSSVPQWYGDELLKERAQGNLP